MRTALKAILFMTLNLLAAVLYLYITQSAYTYTNGNTEANLFIIPERTEYDLVLLGASHGKIFSSSNNHNRVEKILGQKMLNISKTAAGLLPEKTYLSYFYEQGNSAHQLIYFLDPPILFADTWNEKNYFLEDEPFKLSFMATALRAGVSRDVLLNYLQSKFSVYWVTGRQPLTADREIAALTKVDPTAVAKRLHFLYANGLDAVAWERYIKTLQEVVTLAEQHNTKVTIIFPSTLLGRLPGTTALKHELSQQKISVIDASTAITDPRFFSDHDHLNTAGVELFTEKYLKPLVKY